MKDIIKNDEKYLSWIQELKIKVRQVQLKATIKVNVELLQFYWDLGRDIVEKEKNALWGDKFLNQLSEDLRSEFPDMKGFSLSNLKYIKQWYLFYNQSDTISQQPVGQFNINTFLQIPWGHNIAIISKCKNVDEAFFYANQTREHNWSRSVLVHQIESGLYNREGKALTNFKDTLPTPMSELAQQTIKDPYIFDFMALTSNYSERELEKGLIEHITQFLLELGAGFAYIGRQMPLQVGEREFSIDLLFYHTKLHAYIVIELKTIDFEPEHAGKLNFYIKAIDNKLRKSGDNPTIGILLCKGKDRVVVEYALSDINKPIGVSEYHLTQSLPDNLKSSLPSIKEIEEELKRKKPDKKE